MNSVAGGLEVFSRATREWFRGALGAPTEAQVGAWEAIDAGDNALVIAPTGSGKTLAAFLWSIDRLLHDTGGVPTGDTGGSGGDSGGSGGESGGSGSRAPTPATRVVYVSPLKALAVDIERNLQRPLAGVSARAAQLGEPTRPVRVGVRTGDTTAWQRRKLVADPPDILITTPESLYLMLTSSAAHTLAGVDTVVVDEVHAVAGTKRGSHLALSLERLDDLLPRPARRIGLSATVEPAEEVARFLGGARPVRVVRPPSTKSWDLQVRVPVADMADFSRDVAPGQDPEESHSIWPAIERHVLDLVLAHRSTLVFANSRRGAERLTTRLNERYLEQVEAGPEESPVLARAHHGSVAKEQRAMIEADLRDGRLRCVVATSSLELGIDMGSIDLVVQIGAPPSVASGLQRIGRAGHRVGEVSRGVIMPTHQADLVQATVVAEGMLAGRIEPLQVIANPLDVLAQQTVAACAGTTIEVEHWWELVRRAAPYAHLPRSAFDAVLDQLAGRYPSDDFAELRPRLVWDRVAGTLTGRPGTQRLAVTNGGTIPDRGLYPVFLAGTDDDAPGGATRGPRRVGELDEEMVFESRVGDVIALGATSWRIEAITPDRVSVTPAPGVPGRLPFWHGEDEGRPAVLGAAIGALAREATTGDDGRVRERFDALLDERATDNLLGYLRAQAGATERVPSDTMLVVERFPDELGDWRVVCHSPYGRRVNAPWALAVARRIRELHDIEPQVMAADDGIVVHLPMTDGPAPDEALFRFDPDELDHLVTLEAKNSALFAARFRECAARALLLPHRDPGRRSPLWQQRHRAAQLLEVAERHPRFPIVLEAVREVLRDAYDLPALHALHARLALGERDRPASPGGATRSTAVEEAVRIATVETERPSPFAASMLLSYIGAFIYDGDLPTSERRMATLGLDQRLLADLLGRADLVDLLDPQVIARHEAELQHTAPDRRYHGVEGIADLLRLLGPLATDEVAARLDEADAPRVADLVGELVAAGRAYPVRVGGRQVWAGVEDLSRLRDGLGATMPGGVPEVFTEAVDDPVGDLVRRFARTHGPFTVDGAAGRLGLGPAVVASALDDLVGRGTVTSGSFVRAEGTGAGDVLQFVDAQVLATIRRRSLAALRAAVQPVAPARYAAFLGRWQHVGPRDALEGEEGLLTVIDQLAGVRMPASAWESLALPSRVRDYSPAMLDALIGSGEVLWTGAGPLGTQDGWTSFHLAESADLTLPRAEDLRARAEALEDPVARRLLDFLTERGGAHRCADMLAALDGLDPAAPDPAAHLLGGLTTLVWQGLVTSDSYAAVRTLVSGAATTHRRPPTPRLRARRGRSRMRPRALPAPGAIPGGYGAGRAFPELPGRWWVVPSPDADPTVRATELARLLLDRHGVVTRGAVVAEDFEGGFAAQYRVLSGLEDHGLCRRGLFVDGLGAAQFAEPEVIDTLRGPDPFGGSGTPAGPGPLADGAGTLLLAATDPAQPYGAALAWPALAPATADASRPGRRSGALVVLLEGRPLAYLERGGRTLLVFTRAAPELDACARVLAGAVTARTLQALSVETINGVPATRVDDGSEIASVVAATRRGLLGAGFYGTPKALRIRP